MSPQHTLRQEAATVAADPALSAESFRDGMARLGAAVNVVTTDGPGGRAGFTASAVCSVTDSPPTLLVCMKRTSASSPIVLGNGVLCVNTLSTQHQGLSRLFAGKASPDEKFRAGEWGATSVGAPRLLGAVVAFECRIASVVDVGTHAVLMCQVVNVHNADGGDGLIYFDRRYHAVAGTSA